MTTKKEVAVQTGLSSEEIRELIERINQPKLTVKELGELIEKLKWETKIIQNRIKQNIGWGILNNEQEYSRVLELKDKIIYLQEKRLENAEETIFQLKDRIIKEQEVQIEVLKKQL